LRRNNGARDNHDAMTAYRRAPNPLFSDNRLKLGVSGANVSNGCAATTAPGRLEMTWPNSRDIVTTADRADFEALVPVAAGRGSAAPPISTAPATRPWPGLTEWRR
jgi:hypothetical protein